MHSQLTTLTNILLTNIFSQFVLTNICSQICLTIFVWLIFFLSPHCTHSLPNNAMMEHMIKFCQYLCTFSTHFQYFISTCSILLPILLSTASTLPAALTTTRQLCISCCGFLSLEVRFSGWDLHVRTKPAAQGGQLTKQPNNWSSTNMYTVPPSLNVTMRRESRQRKHL